MLVKKSNDSLDTQLCRYLYTYCNTPHSSTGVSPAELLFKRCPASRLSQLKPDPLRKARFSNERMIAGRSKGKLENFMLLIEC